MFSASVPASLYDQLHPPGWCLIPGLEERHRETWARLRHRIVGADTRVRTLLQILVIIQVSQESSNLLIQSMKEKGWHLYTNILC